MQTAADAAALAGVQELPLSPDGAIDSARQYALVNSPEISTVASQFVVDTTFVAEDTITAELVNPTMGLFFARVFGRDTARVDARAVAVVGSPTTYGSGVMPFALMPMAEQDTPPWGYTPGEIIPLKYGDGVTGNYAIVNLFGYQEGGPNDQKKFIEDGGTELPMSIGDTFPTDPGKQQAVTNFVAGTYFTCPDHGLDRLVYDAERGVYEAVHADDNTECLRLWTCPVVKSTDSSKPYEWPTGASKDVVVIGFVNMLVESLDKGDQTIYARFVQVVPVDALDPGGLVDYAGVVYWLDE